MGLGHEPHDSGKPAAALSGCRCIAAAAAAVRPDHRNLRGALGIHDLRCLVAYLRRVFRTRNVVSLDSEDDHPGRTVAAGQDIRVFAAGIARSEATGNQDDLNLCALLA